MGEVIAIRDAYRAALKELGERDLRIAGLEVGMALSTRDGILGNAFPERYFNMGISRPNMVSMVTGLVRTGFIPFVNTSAMLLTTRGTDPIQNLVAYDELSVKLRGAHCGLSDSYDGANHQAVTDMVFVGSVPNMAVISMTDGPEAREVVFATAEYQGPVYLHLSRVPAPVFYGDDMRFEIGKGTRARKGPDVAIIVTGTFLYNAIQAVAILGAEDVRAVVMGVHTVKPIDQGLIPEYAGQTGTIVTVEEYSIYGGLGSATVEVLTKRYPASMERVGTVNSAESGDHGQLTEKYRYGPESIALRCRTVMGRRQDSET